MPNVKGIESIHPIAIKIFSSEDLELLISQENSGWVLEGNIAEELKKEEYNQKKTKIN